MLNFQHWCSPFLWLSWAEAQLQFGSSCARWDSEWGLGLHASVFSWKQFSGELGYGGVMALICTLGIKEM